MWCSNLYESLKNFLYILDDIKQKNSDMKDIIPDFCLPSKGENTEDVKIFKETRPEVVTYTYPADHGFNCDHRSQFNKTCAEIALYRTLKFLEKNLN